MNRLKSSFTLVALVSGCMLVNSVAAESAVSAPVDSDTLRALLKRIDELEAKAKRVDQLEQQVNQLKAHTVEPAAPAAAPVEKWPRLDIAMLGGVEYTMSNIPDEHKAFALGDIDIVANARLSEKSTVLTDLVVASNHGSFVTEIERFVASHKFNDSLNVDIGRFHTAMGWYNNFYHNGTYFQTTRDRPTVHDFEDNGGILPVHSVGVSFNGEIPAARSLGLSYSFEIANGRRYTPNEDEALDVEDDNDYKSFNLQIRAKPDALENWQFGLGAYHDTLTPEFEPGERERVSQLIFSGYAVYKSPYFEWFTEGFAMGDAVRHEKRHWTGSAYTQISQKFGAFRPYFRLQWQSAAEHDPVLELIEANDSSWAPQVGVRYDFAPMMAVKLELEHVKYDHAPMTNEFTTQFSFRF